MIADALTRAATGADASPKAAIGDETSESGWVPKPGVTLRSGHGSERS